MRFCNADLAAVVYRWQRFVAEERAFSKMESHGLGLNDGLLADLLKSSGWEVLRITDACLLSHTPSPQLCAKEGKVWDDSVLATKEHSGGRCLSIEEAKQLLLRDPGLEVLDVSVSHDGKSFGFGRGRVVKLSCIRRIPHGPWLNNMYPGERDGKDIVLHSSRRAMMIRVTEIKPNLNPGCPADQMIARRP